jgi:hypothetical protein
MVPAAPTKGRRTRGHRNKGNIRTRSTGQSGDRGGKRSAERPGEVSATVLFEGDQGTARDPVVRRGAGAERQAARRRAGLPQPDLLRQFGLADIADRWTWARATGSGAGQQQIDQCGRSGSQQGHVGSLRPILSDRSWPRARCG